MSITQIEWGDDGATVTITSVPGTGVDAGMLACFIEDIHLIRHWVGSMTDEQRERLGPEVILLLRDVAPHLICTPIA